MRKPLIEGLLEWLAVWLAVTAASVVPLLAGVRNPRWRVRVTAVLAWALLFVLAGAR